MRQIGFDFEPDRLYHEHEIRLLGFTEPQLRRARLAGKLRCKEIGRGKRIYLGQWLRDWLTEAPTGGRADP